MIHTHDQLFKQAMTQVSEVKRLLRYFVSEQISQAIDSETLELQSNSLLDNHLREYFTDVVYRCQLVNNQEASICLLFEHKSYPDKHLLLQVLYYMAAIYRNQVEKKRLEVIIPIIFIHGKRQFKVQAITDIFDLPTEEFIKYLPTYAYELIDGNALTDEQLKQISSTFLLSMLLAFRSKGNKKLLLTSIREMFKFVEEIDSKHLRESLVSALATYLLHYFKLNDSDMIVVRNSLPSIAEQPFESTAARLRREGAEKGLDKGDKAGQKFANTSKNIETIVNLFLESPKLSDKTIAKIVSTNLDFVHAVRRTFTQRLIKKRRAHFYKFYAELEDFDERYKKQATELFEKLRKRIKKSKVKIAPPPKKNSK